MYGVPGSLGSNDHSWKRQREREDQFHAISSKKQTSVCVDVDVHVCSFCLEREWEQRIVTRIARIRSISKACKQDTLDIAATASAGLFIFSFVLSMKSCACVVCMSTNGSIYAQVLLITKITGGLLYRIILPFLSFFFVLKNKLRSDHISLLWADTLSFIDWFTSSPTLARLLSVTRFGL